MHIFQFELWRIFEKRYWFFKSTYNLQQQVPFQTVFFYRLQHSSKWVLFLRSRSQIFPERKIVGERKLENRRPDEKYQSDSLAQPRRGARITILHQWISASTRIWERHEIELTDVTTATLWHRICRRWWWYLWQGTSFKMTWLEIDFSTIINITII